MKKFRHFILLESFQHCNFNDVAERKSKTNTLRDFYFPVLENYSECFKLQYYFQNCSMLLTGVKGEPIYSVLFSYYILNVL